MSKLCVDSADRFKKWNESKLLISDHWSWWRVAACVSLPHTSVTWLQPSWYWLVTLHSSWNCAAGTKVIASMFEIPHFWHKSQRRQYLTWKMTWRGQTSGKQPPHIVPFTCTCVLYRCGNDKITSHSRGSLEDQRSNSFMETTTSAKLNNLFLCPLLFPENSIKISVELFKVRWKWDRKTSAVTSPPWLRSWEKIKWLFWFQIYRLIDQWPLFQRLRVLLFNVFCLQSVRPGPLYYDSLLLPHARGILWPVHTTL